MLRVVFEDATDVPCDPSYVAPVHTSQIYSRDSRTCVILIPHGAQIGGLEVFPVNKIIVVRQVRMLRI